MLTTKLCSAVVLKINTDWRHGSGGRALVWKEQCPEFKTNTKRKKQNKTRKLEKKSHSLPKDSSFDSISQILFSLTHCLLNRTVKLYVAHNVQLDICERK
jgi:hypothetical protein